MSKRMQQGTGREDCGSRSRRWTWSRVLRQALLQRRGRVHPVDQRCSKLPVRKVRISQHNVLGNQPLGVQIKMAQRQVLKCARVSERARKLAVADTNQDQNFPERARKLVPQNLDINDEDYSKWPHNLRVSRANVPNLETVYSNLRRQLERKPEDKMEDHDVNSLIWGMFMIVTQQAVIPLDNAYLENLHSTKNQQQRTVKHFLKWQEIWSKIRMKFKVYPWSIGKKKFVKGRVCWTTEQFSCQQRKPMYSPIWYCAWEEFLTLPQAHGRKKFDWFMNSSQCRELGRIDGETMEFEWKIFPGFTTLQILVEIQKMMAETNCDPEQFHGRIIFMSMYNDIAWGEKGNKEFRIGNSKIVPGDARRFAHGHWSFLGSGSEKRWYGTHTYIPNGKWDRVAEAMMRVFSESGQPVFCAFSVLERGDLESKGREKLSTHFCVDDNIVEVILHTIISVNQLSMYGAVTDMCDELTCRISDWTERSGKTWRSAQSRIHCDSNRIVDNAQIASDQ